jgi:DHA1 family inner membrane transport protein
LKRSLRLHIPAFVATRIVLHTMFRMVYPFLLVFSRGLGVDLQVLSLALSIRSVAGMFGSFLAFIADSRGRKTGMLFGLGLFTAGAALMALWPAYPTFVITLVLTILGNFMFIPSMQAYLGDRVAYRRRGLALALTEFGWSLSFIIGVPLIGFLISRFGWIAPFPFLSGMGFLALLLLAWLLPRDPAPDVERPGVWDNLQRVLRYSPALAGIAMGLLFSSANEVVNVVFGVWMEESFGLKIAALGAASAVIGVSELGGESLVSVLSDRLGKARSVAAGLALNSLAALALPWLGQSVTGALVGLFLFYITFEITVVSSIPMMTEVLPAARATLIATFIGATSLGRALGAFLAPTIFSFGILSSGLAAVAFNFLALVALRFVTAYKRGAVLEI